MSVRIEIDLPDAGAKFSRRPTKPADTGPAAAVKQLTAAYREAMDWLVAQGAQGTVLHYAAKIEVAPGKEADDPRHVIEFRENGWTIKHPLACRPRLFECPVNRAAERDLKEPPGVLGRFEVAANDLGDRLLIGDRIEEDHSA